ncbi:MAG: hypothetical protein WBG73_20580 [Coleofasciculaceae cyanobacterium]
MTALTQTSENFFAKIIDYLQKSYRSMVRNPKLFLMRKLARFEVIRNWISNYYHFINKSQKINSNIISVFRDVNVEQINQALNDDGYALNINLPNEVVQEILKFAYSDTCYANRNSELGFFYGEREKFETSTGNKVRLGSYFEADNCTAIKKLETDPTLLAIAAKFLGAAPLHMATELWWSFPTVATPLEQLKAAQVFHYDMDDYRFIKFFFYLTDVDILSGPHICIRGSHVNKRLSHQLLGVRCASKEDSEIVDCYGSENVITICGAAGLGFAEDTYCFHKGSPPKEKERLLLQIEFAINDYGKIREY